MPEIVLTNLVKRWDSFYGVDDLSLTIADNAFVTLLGPSGCGKTTTLRMIAGLETPTSGRITIGDQVVFDSAKGINVPPNKRRVGFLFQNYALWPNMTIEENITFGLANIHEELDEVSDEAILADRMVRALARPGELKEIVLGSKTRKGSLDEGRARRRLADHYELTTKAARDLLGLGIHEASDPTSAAKEASGKYAADLERAKTQVSSDGRSLSADFKILDKEGNPVRRKRRLSKQEVELRARHVAKMVKIGQFMDRYPSELSGGQQQRVAIARTLAPEPRVLFMDEPLSNLDAKLRLEMRTELQRLHHETGSTFVYVTHDQSEAMTLATQICLLDNAVLQQYARPLKIYDEPANIFTADFVGSPPINLLEAEASQTASDSVQLSILDDVAVDFVPAEPVDIADWHDEQKASEDRRAEYDAKRADQQGFVRKENVGSSFKFKAVKVDELDELVEDREWGVNDLIVGIRPEYIRIEDTGRLTGTVHASMPTGIQTTLQIQVGQYLLTSVEFGAHEFEIGDQIRFNIMSDSIMLFSRSNGELISLGSIAVK